MTTKTSRSSSALALTGTLCAALSALSTAGCAAAPPQPTQEAVVIAPASVAPPSSFSSLPPVAAAPAPSAAPAPTTPAPAAPAPAGSVDRMNCRPHSPAVTFEVENDDRVIALDAAGCPLGESHFKPNGYSYQTSVDFMTELQRLLKAGDRKALAELVNYPLRVNFDKGPLIVKDRAAFLREFDRIYSPAVVAEILKQDPRDLFCKSQGVMLGRGVLWADNEKGGHLGVIAINPLG